MTDPERDPPMGTTVWTCERCGEPCWSHVVWKHRDCERNPDAQPARLGGDAQGA